MKTIATTAVLMMLAVPTWADEAQNEQANSNKPIVLSETEMDGVTAAGGVHMADFTVVKSVDRSSSCLTCNSDPGEVQFFKTNALIADFD